MADCRRLIGFRRRNCSGQLTLKLSSEPDIAWFWLAPIREREGQTAPASVSGVEQVGAKLRQPLRRQREGWRQH